MADQRGDGWNAGATYEDFMGRWSRPLSGEFVRWIGVPPGAHWLDVGTGTGALTAAICAEADPASVVGCDPSAPFIKAARQGLADPRVTFEVAGSGDLPKRKGGYDAIVSGLALNFFPDPEEAIKEQLGLLRPDGLVGGFVWDYADGMEFLRHFWDASTKIDPGAVEMDEARRFPICRPEPLESPFRSAGAERVCIISLTVPTLFSSFEDLWRPFLGGTGPAPSHLKSLADEKRTRLANVLKQRLPICRDGSITLEARAWGVAGNRRGRSTPMSGPPEKHRIQESGR
jgi:SAM-dependent methyltransferase